MESRDVTSKKLKITSLVVVLLVVVVLLTSFSAIFLYKNHHLNFLGPLYYQVLPNDNPLLDIEDDNLALFYDVQEIEPEMAMQEEDLKSQESFLKWQDSAREKFREILGSKSNGEFDKSTLKMISKADVGDDVERFEISYESQDKIEIPCYLFLHKNREIERAGLLIIPGHGSIEQTAGIIRTDAGYFELDYNEGYQNGAAEFLAKEGFVTLTCENRGQGRLDRLSTHAIAANAVSIGRSYQGVILDDHMAEVSLLQSIKSVSDENIGVAGVSLGGEQALYLGAVDERVTATLSFGWVSSHKILVYPNIDIDWMVPNLISYFDQASIGALIAPRAAVFSNGAEEYKKGPGWFNSEMATETTNEVKKAYTLFDDSYVEYIEHPGSHTFDNKLAAKFFTEELKVE